MSTAEQGTKGAVTDYLAALVWDGTPRLDRWLIDCAGAEDSPYVRRVSRGMFVAAVRRALHPGCRLDQMPVLEGPQGCGKSSALRILAVMDGWFTDALPLCSVEVQQILEVTAGKWIVEVAELRAMRQSDAEALKAFLSRTRDEGRGLYAREKTSVPRSFTIVGTTSQTDYLQDVTGNRRIVPVRVQRFDLELLQEVRDQLWAEAVVVEARGEPLDLDCWEK